MARRRPKAPLVVTPEAREELERYVRRRTTAQHLVLRSRIVLRCATGLDNQTVAEELGVTAATVCKWRGRFIRKGVDGLRDEPRPGVPRKISHTIVEHVVTLALEETPKGATHWSTRQMARRTGIGRSSVNRIGAHSA